MNVYQRGTVWIYQREFKEKGITAGNHPCVIVSPGEWNASHSSLIVMPCTSVNFAGTAEGIHIQLTSKDGNLFPMQLTTVPKYALRNFFGKLSDDQMEQVDELIKLATGLSTDNEESSVHIRQESEKVPVMKPISTDDKTESDDKKASYTRPFRKAGFRITRTN